MTHNTSDNNSKILENLKHAYEIISEFANIVQTELVEKESILPMTRDCESLEAALGYIGHACELLNTDSDDDAYMFKLTIDNQTTRKVISDAYLACDLITQNAKQDSDIDNAVNYLKCCYFAILNKLYTTAETAQTAINNILEVCDKGEETLDMFIDTNDSDFDDMYLNPGGQRLHPRLEQLRNAFTILRPKYNPDASNTTERIDT